MRYSTLRNPLKGLYYKPLFPAFPTKNQTESRRAKTKNQSRSRGAESDSSKDRCQETTEEEWKSTYTVRCRLRILELRDSGVFHDVNAPPPQERRSRSHKPNQST